MSGSFAINFGVFFQKSLKGGGRDRCRRAPSYFPLSQRGEFGGHASGSKNTDCLCLAQVISLPPGLKLENDRSGRSLRHRCFELLGKEPFKCRCGDGLRRGASPLPLLKSAELYRQAAVRKRTDRLRLTETLAHAPSFQFYDYRVKRLLGHQTVYHGGSPSNWQLVVPQILTMRPDTSYTISYLPIV